MLLILDINTLMTIANRNPFCNCFFVFIKAYGRSQDHYYIKTYAHEKGISIIEYTSKKIIGCTGSPIIRFLLFRHVRLFQSVILNFDDCPPLNSSRCNQQFLRFGNLIFMIVDCNVVFLIFLIHTTFPLKIEV